VSSSSITSSASPRIIAALAAAAALATYLCFWAFPGLFVPWDLKASDRLFALRARFECPRLECPRGVVHVDLTDSALRKLPGRQVSRSHYARVIDGLAEAGTRAQLFDFIFASRAASADGAEGLAREDRDLVVAVAGAGSVYLGTVFYPQPHARGAGEPVPENKAEIEAAAWDVQINGDADAVPEGFDPLLSFSEVGRVARGTGFLNLVADRDGVFRRVPLLVRFKGRFFPSLPLRAACDILGVVPAQVVVTPGISIRLIGARPAADASPRDVIIPVDADGSYRINFAGPWEAFPHVSFIDVWHLAANPVAILKTLAPLLENRPVVIADVSTGKSDAGPVPTDARYPLPGVHATVLDNILSGSFVRDVRRGEMFAVEILLIMAVTLMAGRLSSGRVAAASALLAVVYVSTAVVIFLQAHVILMLVRPLLMVGLATFAIVAYRFVNEEKARAVLRESFAAYFPPAIVDRIVSDPALVTASGRRKELTVLFSDICGFTTRCQSMSPDEIREFLNEYFGQMIEIVFEYGGTLDKLIGDGLMVFFGDPEDQPDHAERAVRCAAAMQRRVRVMSADAERARRPRIEIRIGISTGVVTVGNMGSARRLSYTVLGGDVNLAQRLESNAAPGGILLSRRTHALLTGPVPATLRTLQIKGLEEPIAAYEIPPAHFESADAEDSAAHAATT
jgi:adenylate cyclase